MAAGADTLGDDEEEIIAAINVTPLVDIVLVLLIIFMVTSAQIVRASIPVELPRAASAEDTLKTTLSLVIEADGDWFLNGERAGEDDVARFVRARAGQDLRALITADREVDYQHVVRAIDVIKREGVSRFALDVRRTPAPP